ncbi:2-oxoisovalerate dehydrogenase [Hahella chejuensis KCTC 2396]|uniref:3-methyl-2-oxobutanoate dehydrogenase (2-methylpropanoyl-transferring) n=1 Tax=Hahella chejuensis (strain KCTC 2396) TaxID=349521 RepID=Q2S9A3_HAHCH|nr:thiamine pyrophosphate-dependent enzyme [Hahella chejuensis]ABC32771.1 2-oxoisovalerate dehydrogenase [Hahella chejuensis KCTC 2396]
MQNRAEVVEQNFLRRVSTGDLPAPLSDTSPQQAGLSPAQAAAIFESQALSRILDLHSRKLQARGESFYTIGSSGHEGNAAIAAAFRHNDMAFLHYRDAAFMIQRSKQVPGQTIAWDFLLSFAASSEDPIAGGRHKVLGSKSLFIPPQTSTIASHLPKAVGAAYSIGLNRRLRLNGEMPDDAVVLCSFGDASLNHSTAQGAINTSCWTAYQRVPLPLLWVCEDNGIGISVRTPQGWVEANMSRRPGLHYLRCDGLNFADVYATAHRAESIVRKRREPAFLHMSCVRLMGHAGSDAQQAYLSMKEIEAHEAQDPLLHSARLLIEHGILSAHDIIELYQATTERVVKVAEEAIQRPKLLTSKSVMASLTPPRRIAEPQKEYDDAYQEARERIFARERVQMESPQHTARLINWALSDLMLSHQEIILAGEDVGRKGGVYGVTQKLQEKFGSHRVIDTLLDEQSILGLGIGVAHNRLLPIVEIQFLAYVHNAEDQLRGEAATLSFFSQGQFTNPMVVRIAGLAYQKGFGGHFHNDNSFNVFRDIPGLIVACPSNGWDAVSMLRESVRLAREEQRVVIFLEPIALYMTRDLHEEGDGQWTYPYLPPQENQHIGFGQVGQWGKGKDLAIITYGNGYYLSRQAAKALEQDGVRLRIIDLRWLLPLPEDALLEAVEGCERILVVDECRRTGSVSEEIMTLLMESGWDRTQVSRLCAEDSFIPLGRAATCTLPDRDGIVEAARALLGHILLAKAE